MQLEWSVELGGVKKWIVNWCEVYYEVECGME